ncbi:MAG: hypothetical protein AB8B55_10445 [Mariniblastus sp.]
MIAFLPNAWGATDWLLPSAILLIVALAVLVWAYARSNASGGLKTVLIVIKIASMALLAICLLEPLQRYSRPEQGANLMVVMADDSQSLQIKDRGSSDTREKQLWRQLNEQGQWLTDLAEDFDVRRYQFDRRLRPVSNFVDYAADQRGSDIVSNLSLVTDRFIGRPSAGIILMTDGNATDTAGLNLDSLDWENMPPIYPVAIGKQQPAKDLGITKITSSQTNFESAPVTITAELMAHGYAGKRVAIQLLDEEGKEIERKEVEKIQDGRPFAVRFKTRPSKRGVNVYRVKAFAVGEVKQNESAESSTEATIVNNERLAVVERGRGPFRVLYVTGRPNWELKFLRRAIQEDDEMDLVALVRIAKREAKFSFRGRVGQQSNSIFRGFESQDDDTTEQHDEPVFLRLGTRDKDELLGGFPKDEAGLFEYDAIVLDDVEAEFFSEDQSSLIRKFVSLRGGGLLMLGGQESFGSGKYDRTQIGEMLPVYLDRVATPEAQYQLDLTREGWLQPWVRIESTEVEEQQRLRDMPNFKTVNLSNSIKPGATVLATVSARSAGLGAAAVSEEQFPALVVQPFGKGQVAAMLIGDLWRWQLKSDEGSDDMMKSWRQTLRWSVADVPRRVEVEIIRKNDVNRTASIKVRVKDESYKPFDNASVAIEVQTPDGKSIELTAEPAGTEPGVYVANFVSSLPGAYRAVVSASEADGTEIENREGGWVSEPDSEEFLSLEPNREFLNELAKRSGGEVIELDGLDQFVESLEFRQVPITETRSLPWWHRWTIFSIAIGLLIGEWGIRRWKGLP